MGLSREGQDEVELDGMSRMEWNEMGWDWGGNEMPKGCQRDGKGPICREEIG